MIEASSGVVERLQEQAERFDFVVVPGLHDSGPVHWQTHWHERFPAWKRVRQADFAAPALETWVDSLEGVLLQCRRPAILVAHSFGALTSIRAIGRGTPGIAGALIVAPADPAKFDLSHRLPQERLRVPTLMVTSRNDPWLRYEWALIWAQRWGSEVVDLGPAGHVNSDSGYGPWPEGLRILAEFADSLPGARPGGGPLRRSTPSRVYA